MDDAPIIPPPSSATVDYERKPLLFTHDGKALVRQAGFCMTQLSTTLPANSTPRRKPKKAGKK